MENANIKVSVVVPIYNESDYLDRSISSLIEQTYSNIEMVLVNDGSTDDSLQIINRYKEKDSRIKAINKTNGGLVDATITGINSASGEYTCFLDPDDYIGSDFIMNFVKMNFKYKNLDFYAAGFYQDKNGEHFPYSLKKNVVFNSKEIKKLRSNFLYDGTDLVSNSIFISRWNKMYKTTVLKKLIKIFSECRNINLGEDTIFNFIMLNIAKNGLATTFINSYYYNIGNQNSMMNNSSIKAHYNKSRKAFYKFSDLLDANKESQIQAYILYYDLLSTLVEKNKENSLIMNIILKRLQKDEIYQKAINILFSSNISKKQKIKIIALKVCKNYESYIKARNIIRSSYHIINQSIKLPIFIVKNGIKKGKIKYKFLESRNNAFTDINKYLPVLEKRIIPFMKKYKGKVTDLDKSSIEKNIFVFWWDGLESAPDIVKLCIKSIKKNYKDYNVVVITKNNFKKYSHINENILRDFERGKISIQTFSDILRFNLLYYNGGIWSDATVFYRKKFDILSGLKNKSFESICFNTSKNFLKYKNEECSWSIFLMASRKFGLFAKMMNEIYERYYLKYNTFSIYFFTDAVFMLAKINHIDDSVLDRIKKSKYNMFDLAKILNLEYYNQEFKDNTHIPQKLSWFIKVNSMNEYKTNYDHIEEILN